MVCAQEGRRALHIAVRGELLDTRTVGVLIEAKADVNAVGNSGLTALHLCAQTTRGYDTVSQAQDVIAMLLDAGANPWSFDKVRAVLVGACAW